MQIDIITLFPSLFNSFLETSLIARGIAKDIFKVSLHDIRDMSTDRHRSVDDTPYGGGPGMVLRVDLIDQILQRILKESKNPRGKIKVILVTPQGTTFNQELAINLSQFNQLIFICGHFEGFDERIRDLVDTEISLGDFVVTGGELPAMVMIDSIARMIPGFLGKDESSHEESFGDFDGQKLLEYPHYTRPQNYQGKEVPSVLLSGNHVEIKKWRYEQALKRTQARRPDLLD